MSWVAVGVAVVKTVSGYRVAKAGEKLGEAKAKYENAVREGKNQVSAAETALQNVAQGIANRRRMDAAGANLARAGEALARSQEAGSANKFSRDVKAAEDTGAAFASAAFAGVTGGSSQQLVETAALNQDMTEEVVGRQTAQQEYELRKNAGEQLSAGIQGLDMRIIRPNLDVGVSVNQAPKAGSLLEYAAPAVLDFVASYYGQGGGGTKSSFTDSSKVADGGRNGGDRGTRGGF
jgi:hypothetical protein